MSGLNTVAKPEPKVETETPQDRFKKAFGMFQQGERRDAQVPLGGVDRSEMLKADVLKALMGEVEQVKLALVDATKPTPPALLQGKFGYAGSVLKGTKQRLASLKLEGKLAAEAGRIAKACETLEGQLTTAKATQIGLSLDKLTKTAGKFTETAAHHAHELEANAGDAKEAVAGRATLYGEASETLAELLRERTDWGGQVKEASTFLGDQAGKFNEQLGLLDKAEKAVDTIVGQCLPKLTTRPIAPGESAPPGPLGQATVPNIEDNTELEALKACGMSWVNAKQKYGADPVQMRKLANYRKTRVDQWLNKTLPAWDMAEGPKKGWVSVGSSDPTSDYDISLNKHGEKKQSGERRFDYQLVQDFNSWFRGEFGGEGGTVFDTNLYASAPPAVKNTSSDAKAVNDVASLMKMRRYMTSGEFESFRVETIEACGSDFDKQMKVEQQFALADMNYRTVVFALLERSKKLLEQRVAAFDKAKNEAPKEGAGEKTEEQESQEQERSWANDVERGGIHDITEYLARGAKVTGIASVGLVEEGEELERIVEHILKDASLQNTNELYAEQVGEVRGQEAVLQELQRLQAALQNDKLTREDLVKQLEQTGAALGKIERGKDSNGKPLYYESNSVNDAVTGLKKTEGAGFESALQRLVKSLSAETGTRMSQLGSSAVISRFFANEAYQADGPFEHIVTATQAAEADATARLTNPAKATLGEEAFKRAKDPEVQVAMAEAGGETAFLELAEGARKDLIAKAKKAIGDEVAKEKTTRQGKLDPEECLQSFNEQLGDFLKDLEHYGEEDPGKAIIQSSKYLERLLDAARLLADKGLVDGVDGLTDQLELQGRVKGELIAARKGNLILMATDGAPTVDQQEQRKAFACDFMKQLGVNSVAGLGKKYVQFGVKVTAAARKKLAAG